MVSSGYSQHQTHGDRRNCAGQPSNARDSIRQPPGIQTSTKKPPNFQISTKQLSSRQESNHTPFQFHKPNINWAIPPKLSSGRNPTTHPIPQAKDQLGDFLAMESPLGTIPIIKLPQDNNILMDKSLVAKFYLLTVKIPLDSLFTLHTQGNNGIICSSSTLVVVTHGTRIPLIHSQVK